MRTPRQPARFISRLATKTRDDLLKLGTFHKFRARKTVIRQGAEDDYALLLVSGSVKITCIDESGYEALLAVRGGGDLIGEMAPLQEQPRIATATACSELWVRILTRRQLTDFLETHADAALAVTTMVMSRLEWANRRRIDVGACRAPVRVGRVLVTLAREYGRPGAQGWELGVPMTQPELASLAGVALPTVEKTLSDLQRRGLVAWGYRKVLVTDMRHLCEFSGLSSENP